jgi:hypothetical protein
MDKVQKPSDSECYTPSSEHFRFTCFFSYSGGNNRLNVERRIFHDARSTADVERGSNLVKLKELRRKKNHGLLRGSDEFIYTSRSDVTYHNPDLGNGNQVVRQLMLDGPYSSTKFPYANAVS